MIIVPSEISITVIGLGYVGLPTALSMHKAGFNVTGIDISSKVVSQISSGVMPFIDDSSNLEIPINSDSWTVTSDYRSVIPSSDIVLITVPTPVTKNNEPNLEYVKSAFRSVIENLDPSKQTIVTLESTVYPGVTRSVYSETCEELGFDNLEHVAIAYSRKE